jgi:enoyl-CoA hydratase/carnithine racemase
MEMLFTGKSIDANTAASWGLVNRVVPPDRLEAETCVLAEEIAKASTFTIGLGKQAFYTQIDLDQTRAYAYAQEVMSANAAADDAQEGMQAFLQKRPAAWRGR